MATVIRSAVLSEHTRKLVSRAALNERSTLAFSPAADVPAAAMTVAAQASTLAADAQAQRDAQRALEAERLAAQQLAAKSGYDAGHAKGLADAQASHAEKLKQLDRLLHDAGTVFAADIGDMEDVAVGIAFEALTKILGSTLVTPAAVAAVVTEVLKRTQRDEKLVLRLAPQDFYLLLQHRAESPAASHPSLEVVPDERIVLGGCLVETSSGTLDARIETQLAELQRVLIKARAETRPAKGAE